MPDPALSNACHVAPTPVPRLALRPREAAEALSVSERTLYTWTREGDAPPHLRRGGSILYPVADLERWLSERAAP